MPYEPREARGFTRKANTAGRSRQWVAVYESSIARGDDEGTAITKASGVAKKSWKKTNPSRRKPRDFRPGDDKAWLRIWQASEKFSTITRETFDTQFGHNLRAMERRCLFLVTPDGEDVATATAWYCRHRGLRWGLIHWVAVIPDYQGRGLSRCMVTAAMSRMRSLGHRRARLGTQTPRLAAIRTYLRFGFVPDMTAPDADRAWQLVREHIRHPALGNV